MNIIALLLLVLYVCAVYLISKKSGNGTVISIIYAVPIISLFGLLIIGFSKWKIECELSELRIRHGKFHQKDVYTVFNMASSFEAHSNISEALDLYELLQIKCSNFDICEGLEESIFILKAKG